MFIKIQLFAHKKGGGSTRNGRDSEAKRLVLALRERTGSSSLQATYLSDSAAPNSTPARTWVSEVTTRCTQRQAAL